MTAMKPEELEFYVENLTDRVFGLVISRLALGDIKHATDIADYLAQRQPHLSEHFKMCVESALYTIKRWDEDERAIAKAKAELR